MQLEQTPALIKEGIGQYGGVLALTFYEKPVRKLVKAPTDDKGNPRGEDTHEFWKSIMVRIEAPAAKNQIVEQEIELYDNKGEVKRRPIWEYQDGKPVTYYDRFKVQYEAWRSNTGIVTGTPLEVWPKLDTALIAHFRNEGIRTLEQLAAIADGNLHVLGINGRKWRDDARTYLDDMAKNENLESVRRDNQDLREQLKALQEQMSAMAGTQPERRKPGRKPKVQTNSVETVEA